MKSSDLSSAFFHVFFLLVFFQTSFSDFAPYLITTEGSLGALNDALSSPICMARFRANIVVSGLKAFDEVCHRTHTLRFNLKQEKFITWLCPQSLSNSPIPGKSAINSVVIQ